jgi:hypothetical protein
VNVTGQTRDREEEEADGPVVSWSSEELSLLKWKEVADLMEIFESEHARTEAALVSGC